jgi:hypothetical protein
MLKKQVVCDMDFNGNKYYSFKSTESKEKIHAVIKIITELGFYSKENVIDTKKIISKEQLKESVDEMFKSNEVFTNKNHALLFFSSKDKIKNLKVKLDVEQRYGIVVQFINVHILKNYGLHILKKRKFKNKTKTGYVVYSIIYQNNISNYL